MRFTEGVVLCAGASTRMGQAKGLLQVEGRPLLRRHVDAFLNVGLPVTVVLGAAAGAYAAVLPAGLRVVVNPRWAQTEMKDSLWLALQDCKGVVLLTPVDVPPASPQTLAALLAVQGDAVACHKGRDGHPVRLETPHRPGRLDLRLRNAQRVEVGSPDCTLNFNTPVDWSQWVDNKSNTPS